MRELDDEPLQAALTRSTSPAMDLAIFAPIPALLALNLRIILTLPLDPWFPPTCPFLTGLSPYRTHPDTHFPDTYGHLVHMPRSEGVQAPLLSLVDAQGYHDREPRKSCAAIP